MSAVSLEVTLPGCRRLRCVVRGHRWRAVALPGLLLVRCTGCGRTLGAEVHAASPGLPAVDVVRDAVDLACVVLGAGPPAEYDACLDALARTPRDSVAVLARLLLTLAGERALSDARHLAVMHALRDVEAVA